MAELSTAPPPPRPQLLRDLRARLGDAAPGLRVVAEGVLGEGAPIDFVGLDPDGRVVLVLVGGAGEDLELVARGLAQRAWLEPRLRDWLQLAPDLGLRPEAGVRLVLLCPDFGPESRAAARALGEAAPLLATYRCVRNGGSVEPLVEALQPRPAQARPPASAAGAIAFRSGLSDADLDVGPDERREFE
jgi:hypothetical protein